MQAVPRKKGPGASTVARDTGTWCHFYSPLSWTHATANVSPQIKLYSRSSGSFNIVPVIVH